MSAMAKVASTACGPEGAIAAAHPCAAEAGATVLARGGSAVDAAIAAQAVICVVMPQAAGLGGDMLALVHHDDAVSAVNGTGLSPAALRQSPPATGGGSVTVPGLVDGWLTAHERWGQMSLPETLAAAIGFAHHGVPVDPPLAAAVQTQRRRLVDGGAGVWDLLPRVDEPAAPGLWKQPELADLLRAIGEQGRRAFYSGDAALAISAAAQRHGGVLTAADLQGHETPTPYPLDVPWRGGRAYVQPPMSQGVLLAMALRRVAELEDAGHPVNEHVLVEVTEAAFAHRSTCVRGSALLDIELPVDLSRSSQRGGPRAYLHTAGVAAADRRGQVVSSLISVFDDFGSAVYVPELGCVLNNRAAGFTDGDNAPGPGKRPVHTLAPAMVVDASGAVTGLATPGADGQVQTLLQILTDADHSTLAEAVSRPRWRSQDGNLLVEEGHPAISELANRGHRVVPTPAGAELFGAVVAAGTRQHTPFAVADWRRQTTARGVA